MKKDKANKVIKLMAEIGNLEKFEAEIKNSESIIGNLVRANEQIKFSFVKTDLEYKALCLGIDTLLCKMYDDLEKI